MCFGVLQQSPSHISCDHTRLRSPVFHAGFVSDLHPPKKWSWMKDLRLSCLKFWFQKWNRLKTLGEFTMAAMEKKSFYAGNGNPTPATNIPHTLCLYGYIQHGPFCIIWLSLVLNKHTPGTFINQIYPISRWPCIQECPRKMRTFWLPETQC